jgi:hypothetical protein
MGLSTPGTGTLRNPDEVLSVRAIWNGSQKGGLCGYETVQGKSTLPHGRVALFDDFLSLITAGGRTFSPIGGIDFNPGGGGTVASVTVGENTTERCIGVAALSVTNVADLIGASHTSAGLSTGFARIRVSWRVAPETLSTGAQEYVFSCGLWDQPQASPNPANDGVLFRYRRAVDGAFWTAVSARGGVVQTTVLQPGVNVPAGTPVPTAGVFDTLTIDIGEEGAFNWFYINEVLVATHQQSPAGINNSFAGANLTKSVGGTARRVLLDSFSMEVTQSGKR